MRYSCPCCGFLTFEEKNAEFDICPVCYWERDPVQEKDEAFSGGANKYSLMDSRINFMRYGVSDTGMLDHVRRPLPEEYPVR